MHSIQHTLTAALLLATAVGAHAINQNAGEAVRNIPGADHIVDWSRVDDRHVLVNLRAEDTYLLTLKHQCVGLAWAQNVTVTMSNNTIWAGFDAIEADGRQCPIDRIVRMRPKDLLELKSAESGRDS